MSNVDEDVGHTVVHFLYTGGYETVNSPLDEGISDLAREYKRSVLVYQASRIWGLADLKVLSQQKMQHLDEDLPVLVILRIMRDIFSSLPTGETWLPSYIQGNLQRSLKPNDPGLGLREFYDVIGQDHRFDIAVMKMIIEILSIRIVSMKEQQVKTPNGIVSNETPLEGPVSEVPEPVPAEAESFVEYSEPVSEEPDPVFEGPEPVSEKPYLVSEGPEAVPAEPESFIENSEPVSEETESFVEEPDPTPEETECLSEEREPSTWDLPAEADGGLWIIPRVPAEVGDWPRPWLLPEDTPNAETQEASDQAHIAKITCSDLKSV
ncbi:hypothetical protein PEX1_086140 [Penicillium expansum]|uniref:BTB domain-containing protein n=1 Tax=Penicillium expansum TaxID=27334 RepID=A0A0A2JZ30_PENEN|nr:hypothetical protein PEX2_006470 [Penicillium expansum]KGO51571.1 hypothetical protein PEX2_006470 [Penicillium expansum]KGO59913.1 hypothetical protein PEX1_086140 [Penicillium expansum]